MGKTMSIHYQQYYLHQRPNGATTDNDVKVRSVEVGKGRGAPCLEEAVDE